MRFANCFERVAIVKAKLIPLVYFTASRLCDLCGLSVSASLLRTYCFCYWEIGRTPLFMDTAERLLRL
jgi:hypothetical protein